MDRDERISKAINAAKAAINLLRNNEEIAFKIYMKLLSFNGCIGINTIILLAKSNLKPLISIQPPGISITSKRQLVKEFFDKYYDISQRKTAAKLVKAIREEKELVTVLEKGIKLLSIKE